MKVWRNEGIGEMYARMKGWQNEDMEECICGNEGIGGMYGRMKV